MRADVCTMDLLTSWRAKSGLSSPPCSSPPRAPRGTRRARALAAPLDGRTLLHAAQSVLGMPATANTTQQHHQQQRQPQHHQQHEALATIGGVGPAAALPEAFRGHLHRVAFRELDETQQRSIDRLSEFPASWAPREPGAGELARMAEERAHALERSEREHAMFKSCPNTWCNGRYPAEQIVEMAASCACLHRFEEAAHEAALADAVATRERKAATQYEELRQEAEEHVAEEERGAKAQAALRDAALAEAEGHAADEKEWVAKHHEIKKERKDLEAALIETAELLNAAQNTLAEHATKLEKAQFFVDGYEAEIEGCESDMVEFKFRAVELAAATAKRAAANDRLRGAVEKRDDAKRHHDQQAARAAELEAKMAADQTALDVALAKNSKRAKKALGKAQARARDAEGRRVAHNLEAVEHGRTVTRNAKIEAVHRERQQAALDQSASLRAAMVGHRAGVREPHLRRLEGYTGTMKRRPDSPPSVPARLMAPLPGAEDLSLRVVEGGGEHDPSFRDYLSGARRKAQLEREQRHDQCPYCAKVLPRAMNRDAAGHIIDVEFPTVIIDPKVHPYTAKMLADQKLMRLLKAEQEEAAKAEPEAQAPEQERPGTGAGSRPGTSGGKGASKMEEEEEEAKKKKKKKLLLKIRVSPEMLAHWTEEEGVDGAEDFSESDEEVEVEDSEGEEEGATKTIVRTVRRYHGASCPVVVMCRHHGCAQLLAREEAVAEAAEHDALGVEPLDVETHCEALRLTHTWRHERYGRKPEPPKVKLESWQCKNCLVRNLFGEKGPDGKPATDPVTGQLLIEKCSSCGKPRLTAKEMLETDDEIERLRAIAEKAQKELHETPQERAAREARDRKNKRQAAKDRRKHRQAKRKHRRGRRGSQQKAEKPQLLDAQHAHEEESCPFQRWHTATHTKDRHELRRWINAQHERYAFAKRVATLAVLLRAGDHVFLHSTRAGETGPVRGSVLANYEVAVVAPGRVRGGRGGNVSGAMNPKPKAPWRWAHRGDVIGPHPASKERLHVPEDGLHMVIDVFFFEHTKEQDVITLRGDDAPGARRVAHTVLLADVLPPIAFPLPVITEGFVTAKGITPHAFTGDLRAVVLAALEADQRFGLRVPDGELLNPVCMPKLDMQMHDVRDEEELDYEFEGGAGRRAAAAEASHEGTAAEEGEGEEAAVDAEEAAASSVLSDPAATAADKEEDAPAPEAEARVQAQAAAAATISPEP